MRLVYLIGDPGAGKSTLVRAMLKGMDPGVRTRPVPHVHWYEGDNDEPTVVTLEKLRSGFSGTDSLVMSVQPTAQAWLATAPYPVVLAEGDRLANGSFFEAMREARVNLTVAWLDTPTEVAAERRASRGGRQQPAWVKGRETKVRNLVEQWGPVRLDGTAPTAETAEQLRALLTPATA